jgi:hypothetical protein
VNDACTSVRESTYIVRVDPDTMSRTETFVQETKFVEVRRQAASILLETQDGL